MYLKSEAISIQSLGVHPSSRWHRSQLTISRYSGRKELDRLMIEKRVGVYLGIDPTGPSLHVGHLVPLMSLFWMFVHGFHSVTLVCRSNSIVNGTNKLCSLVALQHRLEIQLVEPLLENQSTLVFAKPI